MYNLISILNPKNAKKSLMLACVPLIIAQLVERLFYIVDNFFVAKLGNQALLIHSIQFNFANIGLFIGLATATSCLIFWNRDECKGRQGSVFLSHIYLTIGILLAVLLCMLPFLNLIINHFSISPQYNSAAKTYIVIGLINMLLLALFGSLSGMLIALGRQKYSMMIACTLLALNIILDGIGVGIASMMANHGGSVYIGLVIIGLSTTVMYIGVIGFYASKIIKEVDGWQAYSIKPIGKVWSSEIGIAFCRGITPVIYAFQLGAVTSAAYILVTYQLILQISYIFCITLISSTRIAVREASSNYDQDKTVKSWFPSVFVIGLLPCTVLLGVGIIFPEQLVKMFYGYTLPQGQGIFVIMFFFACIVGQWGNTIAVQIRAAKASHMMTINFFISEFVMTIGATGLLIVFDMATPFTLGCVTLLFTSMYFLLNLIIYKIFI